MEQGVHAMLAQPNHDELARQEFMLHLRRESIAVARQGSRTVYEQRVEPGFRRVHGRPPKDRHEVRKAMERDFYGQFSGTLRLTQQEMMWDSVGTSVERQIDDLMARAAQIGKRRKRGSLRLDPSLDLPRYVTAVDIHFMPGNYSTDLQPDDVFAGALYDRGAYLRGMGGGGPLLDNAGRSLARWLKAEHPSFKPRRILDVGCSIGHSAMGLLTEFPKADLYCIDIGAPMLRYGHARAEALGVPVHFSQQNAEKTDFADGSFDLIVGFAMLHETSTRATHHIFREAHRLLAPGGLVLHYEGPPWNRMSDFDAAVHDWDTHYNAEPFIGKVHDLDPARIMADAGFAASNYVDVYIPSAIQSGGPRGTTGSKPGMFWFFGGWR